MFEAGLNSLLQSDPGISAQLGGSPFARADNTSGIFPAQMPEASTLPAVVYSVVGEQCVHSVQGTNRLAMKRLEIHCYGRHYADAKNLQEAVLACLLPFRGTLNEGTVVNGILQSGEVDAFEYAPFIYCAILDFNAWIIQTNS
jgi:hypothetical protein